MNPVVANKFLRQLAKSSKDMDIAYPNTRAKQLRATAVNANLGQLPGLRHCAGYLLRSGPAVGAPVGVVMGKEGGCWRASFGCNTGRQTVWENRI